MSSLSGIVSNTINQNLKEDLSSMASALRIHGPDSSTCWLSRKCALASNLRMVNPEDRSEAQPLVAGAKTLVADLRLDNREELIAKIGLEPGSSNLLPDSKLLMAAYQKWGEDCVEELVGAFVFAIWDESRQRLFMARDQIGNNTVFYHLCGDAFSFASMPKGLLALHWIPRVLNEQKVAEFLTLNHNDHQSSFFKGIHRLPPGHRLIYANSSLAISRYWELSIDRNIELPSDADYAEQGQEILATCIRSSLRSNGKAGATISGGLDSSTVTCIAGKLLAESGAQLPTFTEVPRAGFAFETSRRYGNERPWVEAICRRNQSLRPRFIVGLTEPLLARIDQRLAELDAPYRNPFNQLWLEKIFRTAAEEGCNVMLTGQSGNMTLSYDGLWALPELFLRGHWKLLSGAIRGASKASGVKSTGLIRSNLIKPLLPKHLWDLIQKARTRRPSWAAYSALNPDFASEIEIESINAAAGHDASYRPRLSARENRRNAFLGLDFRGEIIQQLAAHSGVELRDPLGDIRFAQWSFSLPESQFLSDKGHRLLSKRIAADYLPQTVLDNQRSGLQGADWSERLEADLESLETELETLASSELCCRILDIEKMRTLLESWQGNLNGSQQAYRQCLCRALVAGRMLWSFDD